MRSSISRSRASSTASYLAPAAPRKQRLTCIALTLLATLCSGYESTLVDSPGILDGSWTVACVVVVAIIFSVPLAIASHSEWHGFSFFQWVAVGMHAVLELTAMLFSYFAIKSAPVGDAVALYNLREKLFFKHEVVA